MLRDTTNVLLTLGPDEDLEPKAAPPSSDVGDGGCGKRDTVSNQNTSDALPSVLQVKLPPVN